MKIQEKATLVKLTISLPGNNRRDAKLTGEVLTSHNMGREAGKWMKQVWPDEATKPLTSLAGEIRVWSYSQTLPWADEGYRILPMPIYFEFMNKMRAYKQSFQDLVENHFLAKFDDWIAWAQKTHNGTFDRSLYSSPEKLRARLGVESYITPIPAGEDFRVTLSPGEMTSVQSDLDNRVQDALREAHKDLCRRLVEPVQSIVNKLTEVRPDGRDPIFRNSLVSNVQEIVDLIPKLDLTGDKKLEEFRKEVESKIASLNPDLLRDSKFERASAAATAEEILAKMQGYFGQL